MKKSEIRYSMAKVHGALEKRWRRAGKPGGAIELCLWNMERCIAKLAPTERPEDVLLEGVELLELWSDVALIRKRSEGQGMPLSADEKVAVFLAKDLLGVAV